LVSNNKNNNNRAPEQVREATIKETRRPKDCRTEALALGRSDLLFSAGG
jgi:hypothetical protein